MTPEEVAKMKDDTRTFIKTIANKMSEQNPMSTVIAWSADAFDPKIIVNQDNKLKRKVKNLICLKTCWLETNNKSGDEAFAEYSKFLVNAVIQSREKFIDFKRGKCRLHDFFFQQLGIEDSYPTLAMILKIIFCMSHEQAGVERGFNDDNFVLKYIRENTIIASRFIKKYLRVIAI